MPTPEELENMSPKDREMMGIEPSPAEILHQISEKEREIQRLEAQIKRIESGESEADYTDTHRGAKRSRISTLEQESPH